MTRQSPLFDEKYENNKEIEDFMCSQYAVEIWLKWKKMYYSDEYHNIQEQRFAEFMGWA